MESWCGNFFGQAGRGQRPKILHVERVNAITIRLLGATQMDSVMNPASRPATDGTVMNHLLIFFRGEGYQLHVRKDHLLDDLPRLIRVEWRLEGCSGQHRVKLGQAMGADKSAMLPVD
jgi:hypothetical protein